MNANQLSPRTTTVRATTILWIANSSAATLIGCAYFGDALEGAAVFVRLFAAAALFSSLATLFLVVALPIFVLGFATANVKLTGRVQAVWWTLALAAVFIDTRVYALFRYHLNGMVWNLLTTPGGRENFEITPWTWLVLGLAAVLVALIQWSAWRAVVARGIQRPGWIKIAVGILLALVVFEKSTYAVADARRDRAITARAGLFPAYQRLTMKRTLARFIDVDTSRPTGVEVGQGGFLLRYPLTTPALPTMVPAHRTPPNVLVIVIDSLRADMLNPETMPKVHGWSQNARVFADHASGGNATRFGIFSLVYGIHGAYWMPVYEESAPPVLVTALANAGYDMRVISAAKMSYPEFRSTAWVTMNDRVEDTFANPETFDRDRAVAARFESWMAERQERAEKAPFFCFTLLDSPHQTYSWPPEETPFAPAARTLDYLKLSGRPDDAVIAEVKNGYRNAVRFADAVAAQMIDSLRKRGLMENTFVIVTGDHGEEFYENGFFGHTSNFTPEQVHVTFVMSGPGIEPGVETRPTCHVDLAPTILEALGVSPDVRAEWSQGENLLRPPARRNRIIAGWQEVAVWVDGGILHVPLEGHRGLVEARDVRWRLLQDEAAFINAHGDAVAELARACRRFLR
ncbi:MAG: sulfatase-like hydrolase/transferase [Planctomycetes bacterium]|nr:sulfatase-like hydrolase/transferase [Planctomycetota bacterium]